MRSEAFAALGDPTRQRIVELLAAGPKTAGELAAQFTVSRPAISRHLRVLREAELVVSEPDAQRRIYRLERDRFEDLESWLEGIRAFWDQRLDALDTELHRGARGGA